jgi:nicotinate-nucleotide adenylyltransferase
LLMAMRKKVGLFGGTFDPIHIGHLRLALELKQQLNLDEMRLLPCHKPPHREAPHASSEQRAEMLRIALLHCTALQWDARELRRNTPSYTYDTLRELRAELGQEVSVVLCMGVDAFAGIGEWYRWQELMQLAHLVVISRSGYRLPEHGDAANLLQAYQRDAKSLTSLDDEPAGSIVVQSLRLLPISATEIRHQIYTGNSAQFLVPDGVLAYIAEQNLYR